MAKAFKTKKPAPDVEEVEMEEPEAIEGEAEEVEEPEEEEEAPPPPPVVKKGKKAPPPVVEEEEEEIEVEEKPAKKTKAKATTTEKTPGAPRARVWQYGIQPGSVIKRLKGAEPPKGVADQWPHAVTGTTVAAFLEAGGDRHGLRVMMRQKAIVLVTEGKTYPQPYDPDNVPTAKKPKAAKAAEAEEEEEEAEEPAPPPKKIKKSK
jgi:hypothetical protein